MVVSVPARIRLAEVGDLPQLEKLETAWALELRASTEVLKKRLESRNSCLYFERFSRFFQGFVGFYSGFRRFSRFCRDLWVFLRMIVHFWPYSKAYVRGLVFECFCLIEQMLGLGNFVVEQDGEVVAVLYTQRISSVNDVKSQKFMSISSSHDPTGRVLQLIAISTDPDAKVVGLGSDLRSFALLLAKLDPSVDLVIGVTRCSDFDGKQELKDYVSGHEKGLLVQQRRFFKTV